jgi:hypothetical protein
MKTKSFVSKSLKEIWEIKDRIYQETKKMNSQEYDYYLDSNTRELKNRYKNKIKKNI